MTRHLENLTRLHSKMQARYGENDPLVQDLQKELDNLFNAFAAAPALAGESLPVPSAGRARYRPYHRFGAAPGWLAQ